MKKIIILYLLIINSVITFAQTTDLFYGNPTNNKKKIDKESSNLTQIEKPFILNIGDARSLIGISLIRPTNNNLLYSMGIHLGLVNYKEDILDNKTVNVPLVNLSLFLRTNNKNFNIKFGPYINIPLNGNIDFDETDFIDEFRFGPGIALGFDYSFKSGIALGLTQNLDLFFVSSILHEFDEYNPSWILPNLSVSYRFGTKKTKNIFQSIPIQNNNNITNTTPEKTIVNATDYLKYSDNELKIMLEQATKDEKYNEANNIQVEIKKRTEGNKFISLTNEELKVKLENALKAEDYVQAGIIQKEIDKRLSLKKGGNDNLKKSPAAKNSLKELEADLKNAMDAEDYKKADEIQKEINKLKK